MNDKYEAIKQAAVEKAIEIIGSKTKVASKLGVTCDHVCKWLTRTKQFPIKHVIEIERLTGIPRYLLRPDVYPRE